MKKIFFVSFFISLILILLIILIPNNSQYVDLGKNYQYLREGEELDYSGYSSDGIFYQSTPSIFPKIENYKFNKKFITVKQRYDKRASSELMGTILAYNAMQGGYYLGGINIKIFPIYDSLMYHKFKKYYEKGKSIQKSIIYSDSIVNENYYFKIMEKNQYNYYIIDKEKDIKYGPFSESNFNNKFYEMHLPNNLKL